MIKRILHDDKAANTATIVLSIVGAAAILVARRFGLA